MRDTLLSIRKRELLDAIDSYLNENERESDGERTEEDSSSDSEYREETLSGNISEEDHECVSDDNELDTVTEERWPEKAVFESNSDPLMEAVLEQDDDELLAIQEDVAGQSWITKKRQQIARVFRRLIDDQCRSPLEMDPLTSIYERSRRRIEKITQVLQMNVSEILRMFHD